MYDKSGLVLIELIFKIELDILYHNQCTISKVLMSLNTYNIFNNKKFFLSTIRLYFFLI